MLRMRSCRQKERYELIFIAILDSTDQLSHKIHGLAFCIYIYVYHEIKPFMLLCCYILHLVVLCFSTRGFFTICVVVTFVEKITTSTRSFGEFWHANMTRWESKEQSPNLQCFCIVFRESGDAGEPRTPRNDTFCFGIKRKPPIWFVSFLVAYRPKQQQCILHILHMQYHLYISQVSMIIYDICFSVSHIISPQVSWDGYIYLH